MYIESDLPFDPPLNPVRVRVSVQLADSGATTPLDYDAYTRDAASGTASLKCYDSRGAVVWIHIAQDIIEESIFGET